MLPNTKHLKSRVTVEQAKGQYRVGDLVIIRSIVYDSTYINRSKQRFS